MSLLLSLAKQFNVFIDAVLDNLFLVSRIIIFLTSAFYLVLFLSLIRLDCFLVGVHLILILILSDILSDIVSLIVNIILNNIDRLIVNLIVKLRLRLGFFLSWLDDFSLNNRWIRTVSRLLRRSFRRLDS